MRQPRREQKKRTNENQRTQKDHTINRCHIHAQCRCAQTFKLIDASKHQIISYSSTKPRRIRIILHMAYDTQYKAFNQLSADRHNSQAMLYRTWAESFRILSAFGWTIIIRALGIRISHTKYKWIECTRRCLTTMMKMMMIERRNTHRTHTDIWYIYLTN